MCSYVLITHVTSTKNDQYHQGNMQHINVVEGWVGGFIKFARGLNFRKAREIQHQLLNILIN